MKELTTWLRRNSGLKTGTVAVKSKGRGKGKEMAIVGLSLHARKLLKMLHKQHMVMMLYFVMVAVKS